MNLYLCLNTGTTANLTCAAKDGRPPGEHISLTSQYFPSPPPPKKNKSNFIWKKNPKGRFSWWLGPPGDPGSLRLHSDLRPDVELDRGGDDGEIEGFLAVKVI